MIGSSSITVIFTCHKCGLQRVRVLVPVRGRKQDLKSWMDRVTELCGKRHTALSPTCTERKCDLAIPTPLEGDGVGMSSMPVPETLSDDFLKSKGAN